MSELPPKVSFQGQPRPGGKSFTTAQVVEGIEELSLQKIPLEKEQILALAQKVEILEARLSQQNRLINILSKLNPNPLRSKINDLFDRKPASVGAVLIASTCATILVGSYMLDPDFTQKVHLGSFTFMSTAGTAFGAGMFKLMRMGEESADTEMALLTQPKVATIVVSV